jgi:inactivated superfamily I helicase
MFKRFAFSALLALTCAGCQSTKVAGGATQLVVNSQDGEQRFELGNLYSATCSLESENGVIPLSDSDCLILRQLLSREALLKSDAKKSRQAIASIRDTQATLGRIAVDAAVVSAGAANMVDALKTNDEETQKLLDQVSKDYSQLNEETNKFLAALIEQYKALNDRIDKSIPNYQQ